MILRDDIKNKILTQIQLLQDNNYINEIDINRIIINIDNNYFFLINILKSDKWNKKIFEEIIINNNIELKNIIFNNTGIYYNNNFFLWIKKKKRYDIIVDIINSNNFNNIIASNNDILIKLNNNYIKLILENIQLNNIDLLLIIFKNSYNNYNYKILNYIINNNIELLIYSIDNNILDEYFIFCYHTLIDLNIDKIINILNNFKKLYDEIIRQKKYNIITNMIYIIYYFFNLYYKLNNFNKMSIISLIELKQNNNLEICNNNNNYWNSFLSNIYKNIFDINNEINLNIDWQFKPYYSDMIFSTLIFNTCSFKIYNLNILKNLLNIQNNKNYKLILYDIFKYCCLHDLTKIILNILNIYTLDFISLYSENIFAIYLNFCDNNLNHYYKFNEINYKIIKIMLYNDNNDKKYIKTTNHFLYYFFNNNINNFHDYTLSHNKLLDFIYSKDINNEIIKKIEMITFNVLIIKHILYTDEYNNIIFNKFNLCFDFINKLDIITKNKIINQIIYLLEYNYNNLLTNVKLYFNIFLILEFIINIINIHTDIKILKDIWHILTFNYNIYLTTSDYNNDYFNYIHKFNKLFKSFLHINNTFINDKLELFYYSNISNNNFNFLEYLLYYSYNYHSDKIINIELIDILINNNALINIKNFFNIIPDVKESIFNVIDDINIITIYYTINQDNISIYQNIFNTLYINQRLFNTNIVTRFKFYNLNTKLYDDAQDIKGLSKTIFNEFAKELEFQYYDDKIELKNKLLIFDKETGYYNFNPYNNNLSYYIFLGKMFSLSIYYNIPLHIKLHPLLLFQIFKYTNIIGIPLDDLLCFINKHYNNLLSKYPLNLLNYDNFIKKPIYYYDNDDIINVEFDNIKTFIIKYYYDTFYNLIKYQLENFKLGFTTISFIDYKYLTYFNINDLEKIIIGVNNITFDILKKHLKIIFKTDILNYDDVIWKILEYNSLDDEYLKILIEFCTGTPFIPLNGYIKNELKIIIDNIDNIILCHTCFNYCNINIEKYNIMNHLYLQNKNIMDISNNELFLYLSKFTLKNIINSGFLLF
jgi:hypothetical protein